MTFDEAYKKLFPSIVRYCYYRNGHDLFYAQEAASESFLTLFRKWKRMKSYDEKYLASWLFGTAENKMKEIHRKNPPICDSFEKLKEYIDQLSSENEIAYNDETQRFNMYIQRIEKVLSRKDKQLFHYIVVDKLTYKETADKIHSTENAVKLRWLRLREKIKPFVKELISNSK